MKLRILIICLIFSKIIISQAQKDTLNDLDDLVHRVILLSEDALFDARFTDAREILKLSYFKKFKEFNGKHEVQLTVQDLRIVGFMNIVYQKESDARENLKRLKELLPGIIEIKEQDVQADFYRSYSNALRSLKKFDSARVYETMAIEIYKEIGRLDKVAEMQAGLISREHNQYLKDNRREDILNLIPKYQKEIKFSSLHSKDAQAYNTRHLAQIHLRQTLDYDAALKLFTNSLDLRKEIGFKPFIPASYSSIGDVLTLKGEHELAIEMYQKSKILAQEIGFVRYQFHPLIKIGDIYNQQKDKKMARNFYSKALKSATKNKFELGIDLAIDKIKSIPN